MFEEVGSTTEFYKTEGEYAVELAKWLAEREKRLALIVSQPVPGY